MRGKSANVTFEWNTTNIQLGNYSIRAEADPDENETIIANNILVNGIVQISIQGDIDGDGKVNILDISKAAVAFQAKLGDQKWNANADMDENGTINIVDISAIAKEYGRMA